MEPSVSPKRLQKFRGAPFDPVIVEAAVESIRAGCHWHIGPEREHTHEVMTDGRRIVLQTLALGSVSDIRDGDDPDAPPITSGWRARKNGIVTARGKTRFPEFALVTFTHGLEEFPAELLPIVADRARSAQQGRVTAEALASRSVTLEGGADPLTAPMLAAFRLEKRPSE